MQEAIRRDAEKARAAGTLVLPKSSLAGVARAVVAVHASGGSSLLLGDPDVDKKYVATVVAAPGSRVKIDRLV